MNVMTKSAVKRKISDDESTYEIDNPSKIRKIEEEQKSIKNDSTKENVYSVIVHSEECNNAGKVRQKLSSILHYERKYKYYCKKHNVVYLIENTRKKSREISKKNRDNLVNCFRSLDLTNDSAAKMNLVNSQQQSPSSQNDDEDTDGRHTPTFDPVLTLYEKISRIFLAYNESEEDPYFTHCKENKSSKKENQLSLNQFIDYFILSDESEDSDDYDEGYTEDFDETGKGEDFILLRSPGGKNIVLKKMEDSSCVNYYKDCCTVHNCFHDNGFDINFEKNLQEDEDSSFYDDYD